MSIEKFDYMVVGSGLAGSVLAERLAKDGKKIIIVERRDRIGGNCADDYNEDGILVHLFGSHILHFEEPALYDYLSKFTDFIEYEHRVLASVDGMLVPIPINRETVNKLYGMNLTSFEVDEFLKSQAVSVEHIKTSEDAVISKVGRDLYSKMYQPYTLKQWNLDPSELDASVTARVPTRSSGDDRYFGNQKYQLIPKNGYTAMFRKMLSNPDIKVLLNTSYQEVRDMIPHDKLIYTGAIDSYFSNCHGKLPYRSLDFKFETLDVESYQNTAVVNYPTEHGFTRISEMKKLTGQQHPKTTIMKEYPRDSKGDGDEFYPVPRKENQEMYLKYKEMADKEENVIFVGRAADYKYYDMHMIIARALTVYGKIVGKSWKEAAK